jgi:hypothetical protein
MYKQTNYRDNNIVIKRVWQGDNLYFINQQTNRDQKYRTIIDVYYGSIGIKK